MASALVDIETSPEAILEDEELIHAVEELMEKAAVSVSTQIYKDVMECVWNTQTWFIVHFPIILEYQEQGSNRIWQDLEKLLMCFILFVMAFVFLAPTSSWSLSTTSWSPLFWTGGTVSGGSSGSGTSTSTMNDTTAGLEAKKEGTATQPKTTSRFWSLLTFWKRLKSPIIQQQQQHQRSRSNSEEGSGRTEHDDENSSFTEYNSTAEVVESEEERFSRYYYESIVHSNYRKLVLPPTCRLVENSHKHGKAAAAAAAAAAAVVAAAASGSTGGGTAATTTTTATTAAQQGPSPRRRAANERATSVETTDSSHNSRQEEDNPAKRLRTYFLHFLHLIRSFFTYDYTSVGYTMILWMQGIRQYRTARINVVIKNHQQENNQRYRQHDHQHDNNETDDDDCCTLEDDFRSVDNASLTSPTAAVVAAAATTTTNGTVCATTGDDGSLSTPILTMDASAEQQRQQQSRINIPLFPNLPPRNSISSRNNSATSISSPLSTSIQSRATRISVNSSTSDAASVDHEVLQEEEEVNKNDDTKADENDTRNNINNDDLLLSSSSLSWLSSSSSLRKSLQQQSSPLRSLDSLEEEEKMDHYRHHHHSAGASVPESSHIDNHDENDTTPAAPRTPALAIVTTTTANEASTIIAPTVNAARDTTTVTTPPSLLENGDEGVSYFFESAYSEESLKQLSVHVPVPDKHGYILGDEFLPHDSKQEERNNSYYTPLLVFVNSRAGPQQGQLLITQLRRLLNPIQIWDLANGSPEPILESFCVLSRLRILVCGGDGTVSWIISALEALNLKADRAAQAVGGLQYQRPQLQRQQERKKWPPIAILPLGTGNDLSRIHGWGGGYNNESLLTILEQVSEAYISLLDRWEMVIEENSSSSSSSTSSGSSKQTTKKQKTETKSFFNYLGVGADAQAALQVHFLRQTRPQWFFSRLVNKAWYGVFGAEDIIKASSVHVRKEITLYADGVEVPLPPDSQGIILLNIDSYAGGVPLWSHGTNPPSTINNDTNSRSPSSPFRRSFSMQEIGGRRRPNQQQQNHRQHQRQHFTDIPNHHQYHTYHHNQRLRWDSRTLDSIERVDSMDDLQTLVLSDEERYARVTACEHPSSCQDGLLEVVSIRGAFHLGQIKVGLSHAQRVCQCQEAKIVIKNKVAVQIDGEPWRQDKCVLHVRRKKDYPAVSMLHRSPDESGGVETEMSKLLDWAEERRLIDSQVHSILMKEFSRRIECKTRQRRVRSQESTNVLHNLKRAIGSTASMSNMTGGDGIAF